MYKRISHNIVEEHFDHPFAIEMKDKMSSGTSDKKLTSRDGRDWLHTNNEIATLVEHIRNYIVSDIASASDTDFVKNQVLTDITNISNSIGKHFTSNIGDTALTHLTGLVTSVVNLVGAAKTAKDLEPYKAIVLSHCDALASALGNASPSKWGSQAAVKDYLDQYVGLLVDQINARIAENWTADQVALDSAINLMYNGPVASGTLRNKPDFQHVYWSGLIGHNWY